MKTIKIAFIVIFTLLNVAFNNVRANDFKLNINYLKGEKGRDSYSITTLISIDGNKVVYSKTAGGYIKNKMQDVNNTCILSGESLDSIKSYIYTNKLNVNDSLFDESNKYKSFEIFTNIVLSIDLNNVSTQIKINGDVSQFENKPLYIATFEFISYLQDMIEGC